MKTRYNVSNRQLAGTAGSEDRMNGPQIVVLGTLKSDGTLELDDRIGLPSGRVQVTVCPLPTPSADDPFWQRMEAMWAAQRARGHVPRTADEVEAERRAMRDESEEELLAAERLHQAGEEQRRSPGTNG